MAIDRPRLRTPDELEHELAEATTTFAGLIDHDVPAFNHDAGRLRLAPLDGRPARRLPADLARRPDRGDTSRN